MKARRYADKADGSSAAAMLVSMQRLAAEDHNHKFVLVLAEGAGKVRMSEVDAFDINENAIVALYETEDYDRCLELCERGLDMLLNQPKVGEHVRNQDGTYVETIECRNYKLNVLVGAKREFDAAEAALDDYVAKGLITAEEAAYRKNGIRTFRMQRTFDSIFSYPTEKQRSEKGAPGYLPVDVDRRLLVGVGGGDGAEDGRGVPPPDHELEAPLVDRGPPPGLPDERAGALHGHPRPLDGVVAERPAVSRVHGLHGRVDGVHDPVEVPLRHVDAYPEDLVFRTRRA